MAPAKTAEVTRDMRQQQTEGREMPHVNVNAVVPSFLWPQVGLHSQTRQADRICDNWDQKYKEILF